MKVRKVRNDQGRSGTAELNKNGPFRTIAVAPLNSLTKRSGPSWSVAGLGKMYLSATVARTQRLRSRRQRAQTRELKLAQSIETMEDGPNTKSKKIKGMCAVITGAINSMLPDKKIS